MRALHAILDSQKKPLHEESDDDWKENPFVTF
jgi:hypothetical protein